ncbi:MAG: hypothetical protein IE917_14010 [Betaproteobacteria bacterium]|nr:hypothetical protein [Betaproteobacteria bacterium]
MIPGMSISTFTQVHVAIGLIGIAAGAVVLLRMLSTKRPGVWTALFLAAQAVVLGLFIVLGFMAVSVFRPDIWVSATRPD